MPALLFLLLGGLFGLAGCQRAPKGMVWIPAGPFTMGTNDVDSQGKAQEFGLTKPWFEDEHPAHTVNLPGFYLDRNEVTNADFAAYVTAAGARIPGTWKAGTYPGGTANMPVASVNWYQANDYCTWAHKRLPTEAEWEKAARGTDGRLYPWGNEFSLDKANLMTGSIQPVGAFAQGRSPYGVNDLVGNVWEWTADWYGPYPGASATATVSKDFGQQFKVVRGKSWTKGFGHQENAEVGLIIAHEARSGFRLYFDPIFGFNDLGFRCAQSS